LWLHPERIEDMLDYLSANAQAHAISFRWRPWLNDPNDDFILELAVSADVRYIVTHNLRNLAGMESFGIGAITPAQMLLELRAQRDAPGSGDPGVGMSALERGLDELVCVRFTALTVEERPVVQATAK
jgi:hypothetical protein